MNLYRGLKNIFIKNINGRKIKDLFHKNLWPLIQEQNLENKKLSIEIIIDNNKKNSKNEGSMSYEISLNC